MVWQGAGESGLFISKMVVSFFDFPSFASFLALSCHSQHLLEFCVVFTTSKCYTEMGRLRACL